MADTMIMNRPVDFVYNSDTAQDNEFMKDLNDEEQITEKVLQQFDESVKRCEQAGINVIVFDKSQHRDLHGEQHPDGVFPNNWFSTQPSGEVILWPMKNQTRSIEKHAFPYYHEKLLKNKFRVERITNIEVEGAEKALEGTGSLIIDRRLNKVYASLSQRTNEGLVLQWAKEHAYTPVVFDSVSSFGKPFYHTNVLLSIGYQFVVVCADAIVQQDRQRVLKNLSEGGRTVISVSIQQTEKSFCCNILEVFSARDRTQRIILSQSAFEGFTSSQRKLLESFGKLVVFPISLIEKIGGGSARCMCAEVFLPKGRSRKGSDDSGTRSKGKDFSVSAESDPAHTVIFHNISPSISSFFGGLNPRACLYQDTPDQEKMKKNFSDMSDIFLEFGIKSYTVARALEKGGLDRLRTLAFQSLTYEENKEKRVTNEEAKKYLNDEYKREIIDKKSVDSLIKIILNRPTLVLQGNDKNTFIEISEMKVNPLHNLLFCRDQQIATQKGLIQGRLNSKARDSQILIMKTVFENLGYQFLSKIPEPEFLEGGDFFQAKHDLAMLGVGLRTTKGAGEYLMKNDLLGCNRMALIIDEHDFSQDRMHLDCIFNVMSDESVLCLDFQTVEGVQNIQSIFRRVEVYERTGANNQKTGDYQKTLEFPTFIDFLNHEWKYVYFVPSPLQLQYFINFVNLGYYDSVGKFVLMSVHSQFKKKIEEWGVKNVQVKYLEFEQVQMMYGAARCATQISRVPLKRKVEDFSSLSMHSPEQSQSQIQF